ncbi:MAG: hypothetical protein BWY99_01936 [Synergistetes bacterium ADurb.BinA166]|nr:MAG: hypothetical protein BWY99_01936 [Synergistetes bacterium ADurb.BinA166]
MGHVWKNRTNRIGTVSRFWKCESCDVIVRSEDVPSPHLLVADPEASHGEKDCPCEVRTVKQVMAM